MRLASVGPMSIIEEVDYLYKALNKITFDMYNRWIDRKIKCHFNLNLPRSNMLQKNRKSNELGRSSTTMLAVGRRTGISAARPALHCC